MLQRLAKVAQDCSQSTAIVFLADGEAESAELRTFKREKAAWKFFEATPPGYKKVILQWVTTAKREETRAARLVKLMEACAAGERLR